jgi:RND family efflux transporter MFP subunit
MRKERTTPRRRYAPWIGLGAVLCAVGVATARAEETIEHLPPPPEQGGQRPWRDATPPPPATFSEEPISYPGVLLPKQALDVVALRAGRVRRVLVDVGDRVRENDVLATIDADSIDAEIQMAEAVLRSASVEREQAVAARAHSEERTRRYAALFAEGLASGEELAEGRHLLRAAEFTVAAAEAQAAERMVRLTQLRRAREETVIRAPFGGAVSACYTGAGAYATAATKIARLVSSDDTFVRFAVPFLSANALALGRRVRVRVSAETPALDAIIRRVSPELDSPGGAIVAEAHFGSNVRPPPGVPLGSMVRVSLDPAPP